MHNEVWRLLWGKSHILTTTHTYIHVLHTYVRNTVRTRTHDLTTTRQKSRHAEITQECKPSVLITASEACCRGAVGPHCLHLWSCVCVQAKRLLCPVSACPPQSGFIQLCFTKPLQHANVRPKLCVQILVSAQTQVRARKECTCLSASLNTRAQHEGRRGRPYLSSYVRHCVYWFTDLCEFTGP
jgi:hypothetical protein